MRCAAFLFGVLVTAVPAFASGERVPCKNSPHIVGECFTLHGRLTVYNGSLNYRLWPVGSHRLLALVDGADNYDDENPPVPKYLKTPLEDPSFDRDEFADFYVCPITHYQRGVMQHVCLLGASHVSTVSHPY
jgi:hypothetical protein